MEQGHRVNWVSRSLDSRVTGSQNVTQSHVCYTQPPSLVRYTNRLFGHRRRCTKRLTISAINYHPLSKSHWADAVRTQPTDSIRQLNICPVRTILGPYWYSLSQCMTVLSPQARPCQTGIMTAGLNASITLTEHYNNYVLINAIKSLGSKTPKSQQYNAV